MPWNTRYFRPLAVVDGIEVQTGFNPEPVFVSVRESQPKIFRQGPLATQQGDKGHEHVQVVDLAVTHQNEHFAGTVKHRANGFPDHLVRETHDVGISEEDYVR